MERIEQLIQFLSKTPNDSFLIHALALEYVKGERWEEAKVSFNKNKDLNPTYVPTYFHLGKLHEKLQEYTMALKIYEEGMKYAELANDRKTYHEIEMAKEFLEDELD